MLISFFIPILQSIDIQNSTKERFKRADLWARRERGASYWMGYFGHSQTRNQSQGTKYP
jgi:hypothetical protein